MTESDPAFVINRQQLIISVLQTRINELETELLNARLDLAVHNHYVEQHADNGAVPEPTGS